jgi:TatA/E family protein of Tat protein translocase
MFDIGLQEMIVIGVLALLVFGPSKLPELGRMVGRALREFRRASDEFRSTVETNLNLNDLDPVVSTPVASASSGTSADGSVSHETSPSETAPVVTSETVTTETPAEEPGEPFCAQRASRLFHRRECAWVARIPEIDRIYLKSVADGRDQGFATCPVCEPWEPS